MNSADIKNAFIKEFKQMPRLFRAPARINLIGGHTDYNLGYALPMTVDKAIFFALAPQEKGFNFSALNFGESAHIEASLDKAPSPLWAKYLHACLFVLQAKGYPTKGVQCVLGGTIPLGAGISSSAALTTGFLYALNTIFNYGLSLLELAKLAQAAEHRLGVKCGIMDQYAILFSQKNQVLLLDCLTLSHQYFSAKLGDYQLILINSNVAHSLTESAYNERVEACQSVVQELQKNNPAIQNLRDVSISFLEKNKSAISNTAFRRVRYVLEENKRVLQAAAALSQGDIALFGELISKTHKGLRYDYEVSCAEIDFIIDFLAKESLVAGARMIGGGFGGCVLAAIQIGESKRVFEQLKTSYTNSYGYAPSLIEVTSSDGVRELVD